MGEEPLPETREWQTTSPSYSLVHPVTPSVRRTPPSAPRAPAQQHFHQPESNNQAPIGSGHTRQGSVLVRPRSQHPSVTRQPQDRTSFSFDADMAAQQSLFFHFDYTRSKLSF